MTGSVFKGDP